MAFAGPQCLDLFSKGPTSIRDFSEIDVQHVEERLSPRLKTGIVTLTGLDRETGVWSTLGAIEYKVDGKTLIVTRLIERPVFYGQGVYARMIETILQKNLELTAIHVSLSGALFIRYREDLERLNNPMAAVLVNPAYLQLQSLGFGNVLNVFELDNTQQVFLRLILSR